MRLEGEYVVIFKHPKHDNRDLIIHRLETFIGKCENFVSSGRCAFSNKDGAMLIVDYRDIIQMKPFKGENNGEE